ncbi:MAG: hypothetical protein D4R63_02090 [Methylococcaceae bacterium]|nr:MAG: hypothetical protein D4R63_02090 [Methylococcaceae bacterium]
MNKWRIPTDVLVSSPTRWFVWVIEVRKITASKAGVSVDKQLNDLHIELVAVFVHDTKGSAGGIQGRCLMAMIYVLNERFCYAL